MWSCLLPLAFHMNHVHRGVRTTFERHDTQDGLGPRQVRRALSDLGADVSPRTAHMLVEVYGTAPCDDMSCALKRVDVHGLSTIVKDTAVASPARIWLAIDPSGTGVRAVRRGWNRFGKAGIVTPTRLMHYGAGAASLVLGTADMVDALAHAGVPHIAHDAALAHGAVHTCAAICSLPRFRYTWTRDKPHHLWLRTARDANMWPSFIVFAWYTAAMASDLIRVPFALSCDDPAFMALTWATVAFTLYGVARTSAELGTRQSGVYRTRVSNVLQVAWGMSIPVLVDAVKCLLVAHSPTLHVEYVTLISQHPEYTQIYYGIMLSAMYLGNLACALSSAEHHGAVTKAQIGDLINALTTITNVAAIAAVCGIDDGAFVLAMLELPWNPF